MTPISASSPASAWSATKPGVNGPTSDARQQIADERRQPQPIGERAEHEGQHEAGDDGGDQRRVVRHAPLLRSVAAVRSIVIGENDTIAAIVLPKCGIPSRRVVQRSRTGFDVAPATL